MEITLRGVLEIVFFGGIYFFLNHTSNQMQFGYYLFTIIFILLSVYSIASEVFLVYIKKVFIDKTLSFSNYIRESDRHDNLEVHIWSKLAIQCFVLSIPAILLMMCLIYFLEINSILLILILIFIIFAIIVTVVSLVFHLSIHNIMTWYNNQFKRHNTVHDRQRIDWYLLMSYFVPWGIIAMMSSMLLTYGYYQGKPLNFDLHELAFECGGTAWIVTLWISFISEKHSYIDCSANLLNLNEKDNIDEPSMYFLISVFSALVVGAFYLLSHFISYKVTNINMFCIVNAGIALIASIIGNIIGILRGFDKYKSA